MISLKFPLFFNLNANVFFFPLQFYSFLSPLLNLEVCLWCQFTVTWDLTESWGKVLKLTGQVRMACGKDKALNHLSWDCYTRNFMAAPELSFTQGPEINKGIQKHKVFWGLTEIPMLQSHEGHNVQLQIDFYEVGCFKIYHFDSNSLLVILA